VLEDKTLVIGPSWVGDMVMSQSLLKAIKEKYPNTKIDVLAPIWSQSLTQRMPEVTNGLPIAIKHGELGIMKRYKLAKSLREAQYQRCFVLPNSFKSALIPFWAKIPQRIGWRGEWRYPLLNDIRILNKKRLPLMVQRYVALAHKANAILPQNLPNPQLRVEPQSVQAALTKHGLSQNKGKIISLCPGAEFGPSKRWPEQSYATLAKHFLSQGYQVWIFGSQKDDEVAQKINRVCQEACVNLCGKTSLAEAIDLLSLSACVVSNDSGLMHIAASLGRPVVAVYGSTDPGFTPPLSQKVKIIQSTIACSPCFERVCPLTDPRKHHACMQMLKPDSVISAVLEMT
tara:strand:+ start:7210 stop:8238 length:1029 start_codon:yes stop_codon:yes gene_type:complete